MTAPRYEDLPRTARRRLAVRAVLRPTVVAGCLLAVYLGLPVEDALTAATGLALAAGLALVTAIIAWQVRSISHAAYPRLRAIEALATSFTLFILLFAAAYYALARGQRDSFTEPITRLDSLYFTITVFATVGFGDIAPRTPTARAVTTVQMLGDLIFVGIVARVLLGAVQVGLSRRADTSVVADP